MSYPDLSVDEDTPDEDTYDLTWTVYIALAFTPEQGQLCKINKRGKQTVFSKSSPDQVCFHIEYKLLPGDTEANKVDLLFFGPVAKLYKDDQSEFVKTWSEAGQTWVGWNQRFNVKVNRALAIDLVSHKISVHIWNNKDRLCSQARLERVKVLKVDQDLSEDVDVSGGVKAMVNKMRTLCEKKCSKKQTFYSSPKSEAEEADTDLAPDVGMASVDLSLVGLLAGELCLTHWTVVSSCGVNEAMIHVCLDRPFLSERLKVELNPLSITVVSATSLPPTPLPSHALEEKCMPVYCQYKFHNLKEHRTNYERHSDRIYFRDVNVILTGLLDPHDLLDFLLGPPIRIEVHDRDRKLEGKAAVGCSFDDVNEASQNHFNYHGVASLTFSELLHGKTHFKVSLPIKCCSPPHQDVDMSTNQVFPPADYLKANSDLRVRVKLAHPLDNAGLELGSYEAPFGRAVYIFDSSNVAVMNKLRSNILKSNADVLDFDSETLENTEKALSNYTTHFKQGRSQDLDFITGFHVVDKKTQMVVVEGLQHKALRRLWEAVPMKLSGSKEEQVIVLYNSSLSFLRRIYDTLDLGLRPVFLPEALETLMKEPLLYVTGTVPHQCLQALLRLNQLCQVRSLTDVVQYNLFPSADMIVSLSRQYESSTEECVSVQRDRTLGHVKGHLTTESKTCASGNFINQDVVFRRPQDFIQENIQKVHENSAHLQEPVIPKLRLKTAGDSPAHNYSIQTYNSNTLNQEWLQREMAKLPDRRFTFCQKYHSATVEPGQNRAVSKTKDMDPTVFTTVQGQVPVLEAETLAVKPTYRSPLRTWDSSLSRSKMHPKTPDPARVEELRKEI